MTGGGSSDDGPGDDRPDRPGRAVRGDRRADGDRRGSRLPSTPRGRDAAAWGLVGTLSFLVLYGGYLLVGGRPLPAVAVVAVAVLVGVVAGASADRLTRALSARVGRTERAERAESAENEQD